MICEEEHAVSTRTKVVSSSQGGRQGTGLVELCLTVAILGVKLCSSSLNLKFVIVMPTSSEQRVVQKPQPQVKLSDKSVGNFAANMDISVDADPFSKFREEIGADAQTNADLLAVLTTDEVEGVLTKLAPPLISKATASRRGGPPCRYAHQRRRHHAQSGAVWTS